MLFDPVVRAEVKRKAARMREATRWSLRRRGFNADEIKIIVGALRGLRRDQIKDGAEGER